MQDKISEVIRKAKLLGQKFIKEDNGAQPKSVKLRQYQYLIAIIIAIIFGFVFLGEGLKMVMGGSVRDKTIATKGVNNADLKQKIKLGTSSVNGAKKWETNLEERITDEGSKRSEALENIEKVIMEGDKALEIKSNKEFSEIKDRLSFLIDEVENLKKQNTTLRDQLDEYNAADHDVIKPLELSTTEIIENDNIQAPVSSWNHIPATSYVSGLLLTGIVVSTSLNTKDNPVPLAIRLTDRGSLPKDFAINLNDCKILASCYGDISSERANIRAEELVCQNKEQGIYISTKIAGLVYGDDGMNGIRGSVVSMGEKHLKNAVIGGVLSGLSGVAKGQSGYNISSLGAISTKKKGFADIAEEGILSGSTSAAEMLAKHHIKLAENISPVILIPGGTKVDIMFTKSVQVGAGDIEQKIANDRMSRRK